MFREPLSEFFHNVKKFSGTLFFKSRNNCEREGKRPFRPVRTCENHVSGFKTAPAPARLHFTCSSFA